MSLHFSFSRPAVHSAVAGTRSGTPATVPSSAGARTVILALAIGLGQGLAAPAVSAEAAELQLYRSLALAPPGRWVDVAVPLTPEGWRVGTPEGPAASAADLARWRAAPGLVVLAGRCSGTQSGNTHYPCAFELALPQPAGTQPADRVAALAPWQTTSDERMARFDLGVVLAPSAAHGGLGPQASPLLRGLLPDDSRLLGFYAPAPALLGAGGTAAPTLRLRGVDNPLQHARFERTGLLVLSTRRVPAPAPVLATSQRAI